MGDESDAPRTLTPLAPSSADGPGAFTSPQPLGGDLSDDLHPLAPETRLADPADAVPLDVKEIDPPNAPPTTVPETFTIKKQSDARNDIDVTGAVLADGKDANLGQGAETRLAHDKVTLTLPEFEADAVTKKVDLEKNKFTLKGKVTIQIFYNPNGGPKEVARYGRGTTSDDKTAKNTTSGFHESCHLADFKSWLKTKPLPVFTGKIGDTITVYEKALTDYEAAWEKYFADAEAESVKKTDEVGLKKSVFDKANPKKP